MSKTNRDSNLELFRIIAMVMVIALHQNIASNALTELTIGQGNFYIANAVETLSICAVNSFVFPCRYITSWGRPSISTWFADLPSVFYLCSSLLATVKNWIFSKTVCPLIERLSFVNYSI